MIESLNKNKSIVETQQDTSLREAWNRFTDDSYTLEDVVLIMDSVRDDENSQVFYDVLKKVGNESLSVTPPETEEQKEAYRKEAARIYAEYERNCKKRLAPVSSRNMYRIRRIWYAAAAVLLLGLLIPAAYLYMQPKTEPAEVVVQYVEETTGRGEIKTIVLPDQTKVTLNVESSLKYPAVFAGERSVELQGEALFDVTHDSDHPFTVVTADMNVSVLGTVFDIKAYLDDELLLVSVASGKVEVETGRAASHQDSRTSSILLEKNHQLKIDKTTGKFEKLTIDTRNYHSWTDGVLFFNETPIREVVLMLNRSCPQMVFELAEGEYTNLISGKLDTKQLITKLNLYTHSFGLKYKKAGNKITLYK